MLPFQYDVSVSYYPIKVLCNMNIGHWHVGKEVHSYESNGYRQQEQNFIDIYIYIYKYTYIHA